jgi:hypothetical protein
LALAWTAFVVGIVCSTLHEAGKVTPVIECLYPLTETSQVLRHGGEGHARGRVVIIV